MYSGWSPWCTGEEAAVYRGWRLWCTGLEAGVYKVGGCGVQGWRPGCTGLEAVVICSNKVEKRDTKSRLNKNPQYAY